MEYIVKAHSPSTNETQREINLMTAAPTTEQLAQRLANDFAQRMNARTGRTDWVGQIEAVDHGYSARTR